MTALSIVCATSLADGKEMFSSMGRVTMLPEAEITPAALRGFDALFTRSKVKINDALLDAGSLQFYGTATAGVDHVDVAALERRGIAWAHAPGSNANSVAEYVVAALARLGCLQHITWTRKTIGIIGAGQVGSRLAALAHAFGLTVLLNDPPLTDATGDAAYLPLADVLAHADIISLHVPLTDTGRHPTRSMVDHTFLSALKPGAVFINTSRGEVVDESALLAAVRAQHLSALILDVFDREPDISIDLLRAAALATPHIAGYSLDGRIKGTEMVYRAACRHFNLSPVARKHQKAPALTPISVAPPLSEPRALYNAILAAYDPGEDDRRLRSLPVGVAMRAYFQQLRHTYRERREFDHFIIKTDPPDPAFLSSCKKLGFEISAFQ